MESEIEVITNLSNQIKEQKEQLAKLSADNLNLKADLLKFQTKEEEDKKYCEETKRIKKKISRVYLFGGISTLAVIFITIISYLAKSFLAFILSIMLGFPIVALSSIFTLIRLYRDLNKIKSFISKKLSRNYIVARFIYPSKKIEEIAFSVNSREIKYKKGIYLIDEKGIYFNMEKEPFIDFFINIPNCIIYDYKSYIERYNLEKQNLLSDPERTTFIVRDNDNNVMDVSYSSETLQEFKKDKLFSELHKSSTEGVMGGITILLVVIVIVILIVMMSRGG